VQIDYFFEVLLSSIALTVALFIVFKVARRTSRNIEKRVVLLKEAEIQLTDIMKERNNLVIELKESREVIENQKNEIERLRTEIEKRDERIRYLQRRFTSTDIRTRKDLRSLRQSVDEVSGMIKILSETIMKLREKLSVEESD